MMKAHNLSRIAWLHYNKGYPAGRDWGSGVITTHGGECPNSELSATYWGDVNGSIPGAWKPRVDDLL
jgi:hypothetical protein